MPTNSRKPKGMMLVDDPRATLKALCAFSGMTTDLYQYKKKYEEIINRIEKPVHIKHAHTHFYSLTGLGFLRPSVSKGIYELSIEADRLCISLKNSNIDEYQKILQYILLNNTYKGDLFKAFLNYLKQKPHFTREELFSEYKEIPAKTLIAWSLEAGFINSYKDNIWLVNRPEKKNLNINEFWGSLIDLYAKLSESEIFGIKRVFVDIRDLTFEFCTKYSWAIDEFDDMFKQLLNSEKGEKITLYGAPTSYFEKKKNFIYNKRIYAFVRIMVN